MSERCSEIQELMPWLLNGTLTSGDTIRSLDHVKTCNQCKRGLSQLVNLQQKTKHEWFQSPTPSFSTQLWGKIQAQLVEEEKCKQPSQLTIKQTIFPVGLITKPISLAFKTPLEALNNVAKVLAPAIERYNK